MLLRCGKAPRPRAAEFPRRSGRSTNFERIQYSDANYETSFNIGTSYQPNNNTRYDISLSNSNSSNKKLGADYDKMLNENWWLNLGLEVGTRPLPGYRESIYFRSEISF